jgi:hypothetical protein
VVFLVGGPILYWVAHKDRRRAEPLVRFLNDSLTNSGQTLREKSATATISNGLVLSVGGERLPGTLKPQSIHDALIGVGEGSFVVLESGPETFIQTASLNGGYFLEKRSESSRALFRAARRDGVPSNAGREKHVFEFEEVRDIFMAYASATSEPNFVTWERMDLSGRT